MLLKKRQILLVKKSKKIITFFRGKLNPESKCTGYATMKLNRNIEGCFKD
jgi:hypothetical protein